MSSKNAEVSHSMSSKPPMLSARNVSPEVMRQFENACRSFFRNKEGLESKDYVACIAGGLQDPLISDWYWTAHKTFDVLSFDDFMKEFRLKWCKGFLGNVAQYLDHNSQCTQPMYIAKGCRSSDK